MTHRTGTVLHGFACALTALLLTACGSSDDEGAPPVVAGFEVKTSTLSGANEVPAVTTAAAGKGGVVVNRATRAITGGITFTGLTPTQAHIHQGAAGVPGSVIIPLTLIGTDTAVIPAGTTLTAAQFNSLIAGNLYFNVHSTANLNGEIRGQIGFGARTATLSGANEVPAVTTAAVGKGAVVVDPSTRAITGGITFTGLTPTEAHIHQAPAGSTGNIIIPLTLVGTDTAVVPSGTTLTAAQYTALLAGELYFNVHTTGNLTGEIRGQITGHGVASSAALDGAQETPAPVTTSATGTGTLVVDPATRDIMIALVRFSGISGTGATAAHIHEAAPGVGGGVIVPLTLGTNTATAAPGATLTVPQFDSLIAGNLYFNVHSTANPNGEIRGQIGVP